MRKQFSPTEQLGYLEAQLERCLHKAQAAEERHNAILARQDQLEAALKAVQAPNLPELVAMLADAKVQAQALRDAQASTTEDIATKLDSALQRARGGAMEIAACTGDAVRIREVFAGAYENAQGVANYVSGLQEGLGGLWDALRAILGAVAVRAPQAVSETARAFLGRSRPSAPPPAPPGTAGA